MAPFFLSGTEHTSLALLANSRNQLNGFCNEKGLFLMLGIATTDFLGQESDLLTIRATCKAPNYHVLPIDAVAVWSQF